MAARDFVHRLYSVPHAGSRIGPAFCTTVARVHEIRESGRTSFFPKISTTDVFLSPTICRCHIAHHRDLRYGTVTCRASRWSPRCKPTIAESRPCTRAGRILSCCFGQRRVSRHCPPAMADTQPGRRGGMVATKRAKTSATSSAHGSAPAAKRAGNGA